MIHVYPNPADAAIGVIDTNVDTLITNVAAIKADTDAYLDAAVSSKASQSSVDTIDTNVDTLVTNVAAIKADTDAYLDAAVSSVALKPQTGIYRGTSVGITSWSTSAARERLGYEITAPALSASTYAAVLNITDTGFLWYCAALRRTGFTSSTLTSRITIDGVAWNPITDGTSATSGDGHVAHGMGSDTCPVPIMIRFNTSLKIELSSGSAQDAGDCAIRVVYSLD